MPPGMSRFLVLVFAFLHGLSTASAQSPDDEFDARLLSRDDKRVVQAALVAATDYNALLDGAWGRGSQSALERYTTRRFADAKPKWRHLRTLLGEWRDRYAMQGWTPFNFDPDQISTQLPAALLEGPLDDEHITMESRDGGLLYRIVFSDRNKALDMHDWAWANHVGARDFYRATPPGRLISGAEIASGKRIYLLTVVRHGVWATYLVQSEPRYDVEAALIVSSFAFGPQSDLSPDPRGPLAALLAAPAAPPPQLAASTPEAVPDEGGAGGGTGTGFFVNPRDIVTAAHVVEGCRELTLADGSRAFLVGLDKTLDVAVLSARHPSANWIALDGETPPRLGAEVFALGFPYSGIMDAYFDQGLSVTGGNIGSLPRNFGVPEARIMITSPVQPGNSGGPLMTEDGLVVGVVVSRASDEAVYAMTGSLPQNINFATPISNVLAFLEGQGVDLSHDPRPSPLRGGVSDETQKAVVAIRCD